MALQNISYNIDEKKIDKIIINIMWLIIIIGVLTYAISMLSQGKEIKFIIKRVLIFIGLAGGANLFSTIMMYVFVKRRVFFKFILGTTFIAIMPIYSYITFETNHEVWVLSFLSLILFILYMDIKLIIYVSILILSINAFILIKFKDVFIPEFFNPKSEILIRAFSFIIFSLLSIYITQMINKIFKITKQKEDEIEEEKIQALKTLSVIQEISNSLKDVNEKNTMISKKLMTSSESQAASVEQISASTEELMASIEEINKNAIKASEDMNNIVKEVHVGMNALKGSTEEMMELVKFSKMMIESIESINEIAENTNLLALNAAIEAARAGEAGKGFAVVATEIRKLAEKSTLAAQNVGDLLKESRIKINNGASLNNKVNEIFTNISTKLESISKVFQQISFATQELDKGGKEISGGLEVINQASSQNLEMSKEIENLISLFDRDTKKLNQVIKSNKRLGIDIVPEENKDKGIIKK